MPFRDIISLASGVAAEKIPDVYQSVGNIMLLKFPKSAGAREKNSVADACLRTFAHIETVCETSGVHGEFRKPAVSLLKSRLKKPLLETIHKENDVLYKLDVSKVMFSKGNLNERQRLISMIQPDEVIIDMFAGIGYFTLGIAKFSAAARVYAIEKNRIAFRYLKENLRLNSIGNVKARCGDCRKISVKEKADRVIMGYFPGTERFLPRAFRFLKEKGVVHYHNLYHEKELWEKPLNDVQKAARKSGCRITSITGRNLVKSYAPGVWHVCLDFVSEKL